MAEPFDPYHKWLGIPPKDQPPNHYRLLGIDLFESDPDVIAAAADQRMGHVRTFQTGKNSALSQKILNEIAAVRVCLLSREKKAEYDRKLRQSTARRARPNQRVKLAVDSAKPAVEQAVGGGTPAISVPRISSAEPSSARYVSGRKKQSWQAVGALLVAAAVCAGITGFVALWSRDRGSGDPATHVGQPPPGPEPTGGGDATGPEGGTGPGADRSRQTDGKQPVQEPKAHVAAEERLKGLLKSNRGATTPAQFRNIVKRSLELVDQALLNGQDEVAKHAATVAVGAARKAEDNQLTKTAALRYLDLGLQTGPPRSVGAYLQLQDAVAVLEKNPVDPAANLAMGRHLCFVNRDWEQGIPMLALGSDPTLKENAVKELHGPKTRREGEELADGWRQAAQHEDGVVQQSLLLRSVFWDEQAAKDGSRLLAVPPTSTRVDLPSGAVLTQAMLEIPENWLKRFFPKKALSYQVRYPNGEVRAVAVYEGSKLHGPAATLYEDGRLESLGRYHLGQLDGGLRLWEQNGQRLLYAEYTRGRKNGLICLFREDAAWYIQQWDKQKLVGEYLVKWAAGTPVVISRAKLAPEENVRHEFPNAAKLLARLEEKQQETEDRFQRELRKWVRENDERTRNKAAAQLSRTIRSKIADKINARRAVRDLQLKGLRRRATPR